MQPVGAGPSDSLASEAASGDHNIEPTEVFGYDDAAA